MSIKESLLLSSPTVWVWILPGMGSKLCRTCFAHVTSSKLSNTASPL